MRWAVAALLCTCSLEAAAQLTDHFSDGDFTADPAWIGPAAHWQVVPFGAGFALRSNGPAASDTLYLATPSAVTTGTWRFLLSYRGVNLSNFNGARIYLVADAAALDGPVHGYFLQLGTNNSDEVRLYRQDGDPGTGRVLLGASAAPLLSGEADTLHVTVTRTREHNWTVEVDGDTVLTASDDTYRSSRYFGVWVKHTSTTAAGYFFDEVDVQGTTGTPDLTAPALRYAEQTGPAALDVYFSEPLDPAGPPAASFRLGTGTPMTARSVTALTDTSFRVHFPADLAGAAPDGLLEVYHIRDPWGNVLEAASVPVAWRPAPGQLFFNEILFDPLVDPFDHRPDQPEYVELYNAGPGRLSLRGLALAEAVDERGEAFTQPLVDGPLAVAPGGYVVVYQGAAEQPAAAPLALSFPEIDFDAPEVVLLPAASLTSRGLRQEGETLRLLAGSLEIDRVDYRPAWHNPTVLHAVDGKGTALERISPEQPSQSAANWTSSTAPSGGTPGAPNTAVVHPGEALPEPGLEVAPSPFYPEGVGEERIAVVRFNLAREAALVRARIFDAAGRPVRTLAEADLSGRTGAFFWDGLDDAGHRLRIGLYVVLLEAAATGEGTTEAYKAAVVLARPLD